MKKEITELFKGSEIADAQNFNSIKITLASPEKIKTWTYVEIKKHEIPESEIVSIDFIVFSWFCLFSLVSRHVEVCLGRISTRRIRIWGQKLPILSTRAENFRKATVRDLSVWTL